MPKSDKKKGKSADSKDKDTGNMQPGTVIISPPTSTQCPSQTNELSSSSGQSSSHLNQASDMLYGNQQQNGTFIGQVHSLAAPQFIMNNTQNSQTLHNGQNWQYQQPGQINLQIYQASAMETQTMGLAPENIQYSQQGNAVNMNKVHSVLNGDICKQTVYTHEPVKQYMHNAQEAPPWALNFFKSVESRLHSIETQLSQQNSNWQHIEQQLQTQNNQLQKQNERITQVEQKVEQINEIKQKFTRVEAQVYDLDSKIVNKSNISECNDSIELFNEKIDDIVSENKSTNSAIDELSQRVANLELEHETMKSNQLSVEGTVLDLQCRSMRENLLFTGIPEAESEYPDEPTEDSGDVLQSFLRHNMHIGDEIELDRHTDSVNGKVISLIQDL